MEVVDVQLRDLDQAHLLGADGLLPTQIGDEVPRPVARRGFLAGRLGDGVLPGVRLGRNIRNIVAMAPGSSPSPSEPGPPGVPSPRPAIGAAAGPRVAVSGREARSAGRP